MWWWETTWALPLFIWFFFFCFSNIIFNSVEYLWLWLCYSQVYKCSFQLWEYGKLKNPNIRNWHAQCTWNHRNMRIDVIKWCNWTSKENFVWWKWGEHYNMCNIQTLINVIISFNVKFLKTACFWSHQWLIEMFVLHFAKITND